MAEKSIKPVKPRHTFVRGAPAWKKVLLIVAAALLVVGVGIKGVTMVGGKSGGTAGTAAAPGGSGSLIDIRTGAPIGGPGSMPGSGPSAQGQGDDWSPVFLSMGFGFFAGYCIGWALRAFLKVAAIIVGVVLLAIFGLAKAEVIHVDWATIESGFDRTWAAIRPQVDSFRAFIAGSIPSAGSAALGFFAAFKRNG